MDSEDSVANSSSKKDSAVSEASEDSNSSRKASVDSADLEESSSSNKEASSKAVTLVPRLKIKINYLNVLV